MYFGLLFIVSLNWQPLAAQAAEQVPLALKGSGLGDCSLACLSLSHDFGEKLYHQTLPKGFSSSYFSQQQRDVIPECVIFPGSPQEVSQALQILNEYNCHLAVKSGGHGIFAGASNAPGGVTIDMRDINGLKVADDRLTTSIGTGRKWGEVYRELEPMNLTVVGGRDTQIGVGGFILGGGISFTSRRYGWGLDNVRNFEVVLANGTISNVGYDSHPDLFFALRGGGNQFGIVTRFDLNTYPQGPVWGGHSYYFLSDVPERKKSMNIRSRFKWRLMWLVEEATKWFIRIACRFGRCTSVGDLLKSFEAFSETEDSLGQIILSFAFVPYGFNAWVACLSRLYGEPKANPAVFKGFESEDMRSFYSTNRVTPLSRVNSEVDWMNAVGYRQSWSSATFKIDSILMSSLVDIYIAEIDAIKHVSGLLPSLIMQIITRDEILAFQRNGGNVLGITDEDGPLLLINNAIRWSYIKDDNTVKDAGNKIINRAVTLAKKRGVDHRFIYQNYANRSQDVFAGYGEKNKMRLMEIRKKYDPNKLFARLQPGYFRL